jgi:rhamnulokinase
MNKYAAIDLGAESGRVIVGNVGEIEEVYRFDNGPVRKDGSIFWDMENIFAEIKTGLKLAFDRYEIRSIGLDTWGIDYGLLDDEGNLIGGVYNYRDPRTDGMPDLVYSIMPKREVYEETGIQFMSINTIFQLYAAGRCEPESLGRACTLLTVPNLLHYWLTGVKGNEYSHATTTQLFNPRTKDWAWPVIDALGFKREIFAAILAPGTTLGPLLPDVAAEIGVSWDVPVIATATHDTASAVAAMPAPGKRNVAYISSGTWSLLGIETPEPVITDKSYDSNFTNEGGADGGIRLLKNIIGLWIVQECKHHWDKTGCKYSYAELTDMARESGSADFSIDANDPRFMKPGLIDDSMPDRIRAYCRETGQKEPETPAQIVRGVLESLADLYAASIRQLEDVGERPVEELYIIGGGSRNGLLCELTATTAGIPVFAGPAEATAIGNILVQAVSMGDIDSIERGRKLIRDAHSIEEYAASAPGPR